MAEKRKLMVEIEKCFKKIDEGVDIFEETMSKVNEANSENQRDKLQDDLKKEIKKLQRLRELVKGWQGSAEIKDKEKLNHYRRLVETQMETFKNLEREFKTKPHSKQGLTAEVKIDPKEKEKAETLEWLNTQIRKIQNEIDRTEAKIEMSSTAETTTKRRGKGKDDKKAEKEKVDKLMRHLDKVKFHWQNIEVCMRLITNEKLDANEVVSKLREPLIMYTEALDSDCDEDLENLEPDDIYEELGLGDYISRLDAGNLQPLDDERLVSRSVSEIPLPQSEPTQVKAVPVELPKPPKTKPVVSAAPIPQHVVVPTHQSAAPISQPVVVPAPVTLPMSYADVVRKPINDNTSTLSAPLQISSQSLPQNSTSLAEKKTLNLDFGFPGWLQKPPRQSVDTEESRLSEDPRYGRILESANFSERSHVPFCRQVGLPDYFPNRVVFGPVSDEYFEKLELGTILFSFYYMEGTRAQLLAAKRLRSCSWRFHTRYVMWFLRADEPTEITDSFERGRYVYFDYQRWEFFVHTDFIFKYKYLVA